MIYKKILSFNKLKVNKIIWYLTFSDVFSWGVFSILNVLIGIYLATKLGEDTVQIVGIGTAIYSIMRAGAQIPLGLLEDSIKSQKDEVLILLAGSFMMGLPYLFYPIIETPALYYFFQIMVGLGCGMNLVSWRKLFAKNVDHDKEGMDYGVYETVMSLFIALFGVTAGTIANLGTLYFDYVIVSIGILIILSTVFALLIYQYKFSPRTPQNL